MASDIDKLKNLLARATNKMKDTIDDTDIGDLNRVTRVLEYSNELVDDIMLLVGDMVDRRLDDQDRERDRYEDSRRDDRRDSRRDRDDRRGGSWRR